MKPITFDSDFPAQSKTLLLGVTHSAHATGRLIVDQFLQTLRPSASLLNETESETKLVSILL